MTKISMCSSSTKNFDVLSQKFRCALRIFGLLNFSLPSRSRRTSSSLAIIGLQNFKREGGFTGHLCDNFHRKAESWEYLEFVEGVVFSACMHVRSEKLKACGSDSFLVDSNLMSFLFWSGLLSLSLIWFVITILRQEAAEEMMIVSLFLAHFVNNVLEFFYSVFQLVENSHSKF